MYIYTYKRNGRQETKTLMKWENLIEANRATGAGKNVGVI